MNFFSLDGPFNKYGTLLFDMLMLNLIWIIISTFSFGLLMGPASTALYYTVNHCIIHQNGTLLKTYFEAFKKNFKYSMFGYLIVLFILLSSAFSLYLIYQGALTNLLFPIYVAILFYVFMTIPYYMSLNSFTNLKFKALIKFSFLLSIKHLPLTALCIILIIIFFVIMYLTQFIASIILLGPLFAAISYLVTDRALKDYDFSSLE